jgi:ribosome assembly protein SQT1
MTVHWAIHRLNGIVCPVSATCSRKELVYQLKDSGSRALVTCRPLLSIALPAAEEVGIPRDHIFVCDLPEQMTGNSAKPSDLHTIEELIQMGAYAPQVPSLQWSRGQAGWQTAYICYSSGTSGLPVSIMTLVLHSPV